MSKRLLTLAILILFVTAGAAIAQVTPTSKIQGRVTDAQGAPLPGVSVEATSPKMVGKATAVTDAEGDYRLFSLPSGLYEVTYTLQGFKTLKREGVVVQLSQTIILNVTMDQTTLEETVTVVGQSPLIDVKSTVKGQTMTKETFMSLPRTRNFDGLISTVPGVQNEDNTGGLSVDGATGTENMWYMDGTDITQGHIGVRGQSAVMEMVEEVKVTASGYNAEFGGSMGGVVNVITRSGGNAFHGDIMGYFNNNSLLMQGKARDYLRWNPYNDELAEYVNDDDLYYQGGYSRDPYARYEGVFNLGGYILKDKVWFFGSINPQFDQQNAKRYFLSDADQPLYDFYRKRNWYNGQLKLTAAPIKGLRMSASVVNNYFKWRGTIPSINGTDPKDADWKAYGYDYPNWSAAVMADYSLSNNLLMSGRAGYSFQDKNHQQVGPYYTTYAFGYSNVDLTWPEGVEAPPAEYQYYAGAINYVGGTADRLVLLRQKQHKYSGNLDLTYYMSLGGEHAWKAGFQYIKNHEDYSTEAYMPLVNLYWNRACTALSAYYPEGDPRHSFQGNYGYYLIRGSWTSPYGYLWNIKRSSYALYLQDSWTINGRLTINAGVRAESEYIPSFNPTFPGRGVNFGWGDKIAPRFGLVYDVFGDSSLKVFGSFGIYYDVLKLYMAEGTYGGMKWYSDYYKLDNYNFWEIANEYRAGDTSAAAQADQAAGGEYMASINFRVPSFDTTDPDIKPVSQREISFGAEKKLTEDLSLSVRLVQKHLINTIEDIGMEVPEIGEQYYIANPGSPWIREKFVAAGYGDYWQQPKATREYYGMNLSLEKRFSHNWQGGINYTLSSCKGDYSGLSSADEAGTGAGRNSPNVERFFDMWFMMYQMNGDLLDGPLPQDRTHYIKAYGSYSFPFGLTVGAVAYARSGLPKSTQLNIRNTYMYPDGYGDLGRMPWCAWADLYIEYTLKLGAKYNLAINFQVNNVTNTKTWTTYEDTPNRITMAVSDEEILSGTFNWRDHVADYWPNAQYNRYVNQFGTWTTRLGLRFSF